MEDGSPPRLDHINFWCSSARRAGARKRCFLFLEQCEDNSLVNYSGNNVWILTNKIKCIQVDCTVLCEYKKGLLGLGGNIHSTDSALSLVHTTVLGDR